MQIVVIGLGYVGLPLALALARHFDVTGLDIDQGRIDELKSGHDRTGEATREALESSTLRLVSSASDCTAADAYIVTVPTPIDADKNPDLGPVISATKAVAKMIDPARRPVIIYESTVYPGVTEEICGPLLEEQGGLKRGRDFVLGYSPERINPGDREHTVDRIVKVIAGEDLWQGNQRRRLPRPLDQDRRSRKGHRKRAARHQHRVYERDHPDFRAHGHLDLGCPERRWHKVELPEVPARACWRSLHWR
jgi:nucleotide sugar dehydrogenase